MFLLLCEIKLRRLDWSLSLRFLPIITHDLTALMYMSLISLQCFLLLNASDYVIEPEKWPGPPSVICSFWKCSHLLTLPFTCSFFNRPFGTKIWKHLLQLGCFSRIIWSANYWDSWQHWISETWRQGNVQDFLEVMRNPGTNLYCLTQLSLRLQHISLQRLWLFNMDIKNRVRL